MNILSWPIATKFFAAFMVAVLLPLALLAAISLNSLYQTNQTNLEIFIAENGERRVQSLRDDLTLALNQTDNYAVSRLRRSAAFISMVSITPLTNAATIERNIEVITESLSQELLPTATNLFDGAWAMDLNGNLIASVLAPNAGTPWNESELVDPGLLRSAQQLSASGQRSQGFIVRNHENGPVIIIVDLIYNFSNDPSGYLFTQLNTDTIIRSSLLQTGGPIDPYAYLLLPETGALIASPELFDSGRVGADTLVSEGVRRALNREASTALRYTVGSGENQREVVGYNTTLQILGSNFIIISELGADIVATQVASLAGRISFPLLVGSMGLVTVLALLMTQLFAPALTQLRDAMRAIVRGNFDAPISHTNRGDEIGQLALAFADMREQIQRLNDELRQRLDERNRDIRVTQDISRAATAERDLQTLMETVINLIVDRFNVVYHAQIFLIDENRDEAILRASTGEAGRKLLERGHKLEVGSVSVIGQVTEQGQPIIARDTAASNVHRRNEFLQQTRAELAVPLRLGSRVIGALDVQSMQRDAFDDALVSALQTLADQITIAIENARLYSESQRLLSDLEKDRQSSTRNAWSDYLKGERTNFLRSSHGQITSYDFGDLRKAVFLSGKAVVGGATERETIPFAVPIKLRNEVIGVAEYEVPQRDFYYDKVLLAEEMVNRLAISLDNARLFQESKQATERERIVNDISAKLTGQTDIQAILEIAVREVSQALRTPQVSLALQTHGSNNGNGNGNGNGHKPNGNGQPSELTNNGGLADGQPDSDLS